MKRDINHQQKSELFIFVDDFCKVIDVWLKKKLLAEEEHRNQTRTPEISIMTIELL
ncbi:hypothetical protein MIDIC_160017 [Alphaproteobacteria bacterium]